MKECFVIMPIGKGENYEVYLNRFEGIIKPAAEEIKVDGHQVFRCVRADFVSQTGSITRDMLARLYRADAVIADLTDLNPNVFYELGVRHALRSGTLLVALKGTVPPFDLGDLRVVFYEDRVGAEKVAIPEIQEVLLSLLAEDAPVDSPVLEAIPHLLETQESSELKAWVNSLEQENHVLKAQLNLSERANLANQEALETLRETIESLTIHLSGSEKQSTEDTLDWVSKAPPAEPSEQVVRDVEDSNLDPSSVFVLMPFSGDLEPVYHIIHETAEEEGLHCFRADDITGAEAIIDQVYEGLAKAGLIVADLTGRNQNVIYALGIARAMGKQILLLSQNIDEVPIDFRHGGVLEYQFSSNETEEFRRRLKTAFQQFKSDSAG